MKSKFVLLIFLALNFIFANLIFASGAHSAEDGVSTVAQMDEAEITIYGEARRGGLINRLNELETVLFGTSLPGSISERQLQLLNFIHTGSAEQPSLLFKLGVAEWAVSQTTQPFIPALGRLQKLEQELDGVIQEGKPVGMRLERILSMILTDPVTQSSLTVSSDAVVRAQILEDIGPAKSKKGDSVKIELMEDLVDNNYLIAPKGSRIVTEVTDITRPGGFGRMGRVHLSFNHLQILGPEEVKVRLPDDDELDKKRLKNTAGAVGVSILSAVIMGPFGLITGMFIRGESLDIKAGTQFYIMMSERTRLSAYMIPAGLRKDGAPSEGADTGSAAGGGSDSEEIYVPE